MADLNVVNDVDPVAFKEALMEKFLSELRMSFDEQSGSEIFSIAAMQRQQEEKPKAVFGGDQCDQGTRTAEDNNDDSIRKSKLDGISRYRDAIDAVEDAMSRFEHYPSSDDIAKLWSYVEIDCHTSGKVKKYLIVEKVGAVDLGNDIITVPFETSLGQALLGVNRDPVHVGDEISTVIKKNVISGEVLKVL